MGHSAGGHLAMLAVLELVQQCLIHNPQSAIMSMEEAAMVSSQNLSRETSTFSQSFVFDEGHFDGSEGEEAGEGFSNQKDRKTLSSAGSDSFYVVRTRQREESGNSTDDKPGSDNFVVVGAESNGSVSDREAGSTSSLEEVEIPHPEDPKDGQPSEVSKEDTQDGQEVQEGQGDGEADSQTRPEGKDGDRSGTSLEPQDAEMQLDLREDRQEPPQEIMQPLPHISIQDSSEPMLHAQVSGSLAAIKLIVGEYVKTGSLAAIQFITEN